MMRRQFGPSHDQLVYNQWHRADSIRRFISPFEADRLRALDIDLVEYDAKTHRVVLLHETARDRGQSGKQTSVLRALARQAGCHALCTLYEIADAPNPASPDYPDISGFRVRRVWPDPQPEFIRLNPTEYAQALNTLVKNLKAATPPTHTRTNHEQT